MIFFGWAWATLPNLLVWFKFLLVIGAKNEFLLSSILMDHNFVISVIKSKRCMCDA